mmetsp:Transcript_3094/g.8960  ORF Transcript_3094/g.8960 Transcript_3094/m.8960 type:complete len:213 (-) Transcript_3094:867-1505(-)
MVVALGGVLHIRIDASGEGHVERTRRNIREHLQLVEGREVAVIEAEGVAHIDGVSAPVGQAPEQGVHVSPAPAQSLHRTHQQLHAVQGGPPVSLDVQAGLVGQAGQLGGGELAGHLHQHPLPCLDGNPGGHVSQVQPCPEPHLHLGVLRIHIHLVIPGCRVRCGSGTGSQGPKRMGYPVLDERLCHPLAVAVRRMEHGFILPQICAKQHLQI